MPDAVDRTIINALQGGFPIVEQPFGAAACDLGLSEGELIVRIERLLAAGVLSRFGPMYNADRMGGAFCLCAAAVPAERFDEVVGLINAHPEVAHNYERAHELNVWFVLATDEPARIDEVLSEIKRETGLDVYAFPKQEEYFVGLKVDV